MMRTVKLPVVKLDELKALAQEDSRSVPMEIAWLVDQEVMRRKEKSTKGVDNND